MAGNLSLQTADKVGLTEIRHSLSFISVVNILVFMAALSSSEDSPDTALFLMMVSVFAGLYVFIATLETTVFHRLKELRSSLVAWVLILAYLTYVAKAQAVSEINAIFHVDASLLPMTLVATTAFQVVSMLLLPVMVVAVGTIVFIVLSHNGLLESRDGASILFSLCVGAGAQLCFAGMVWGWVGESDQRKTTIYRVSHFSDFNSSFRCDGIDEARFSVLFANPERSQVIVAPKISDFYIGPSRAKWRQPVRVPKEFPLLPCNPVMGWQEPDVE